MKDRTVIDEICRLPDTFYKGSSSALDIVKASGLAQNSELLSRGSILDVLHREPALIEGWLLWSDNKRTSSGWFLRSGSNENVVGYFPNGEQLVFSNLTEACAEFIVREVTGMLNTLRSNNALKSDARGTRAP